MTNFAASTEDPSYRKYVAEISHLFRTSFPVQVM